MSIPAPAFPLQIIDRATVAARLIYFGNASLRNWSQGRVYRRHWAHVPAKGDNWPTIYVCPGVEEITPQVGQCVTINWSILTVFVWNPSSTPLADNEPSVSSVVGPAKLLLQTNPTLSVSYFDYEDIADVGPLFDPTDYTDEIEVDGKLLLRLAFTANYVKRDVPSSTLGVVLPTP